MLSVEDGKKQNFFHSGSLYESDTLRTTALAPSVMWMVVLFIVPLGLTQEELPDVCTPIPMFQGHNCVFSSRELKWE